MYLDMNLGEEVRFLTRIYRQGELGSAKKKNKHNVLKIFPMEKYLQNERVSLRFAMGILSWLRWLNHLTKFKYCD